MKRTSLLFALTTFTTAAFSASGTTGISDAADGVVTNMPYMRSLCYAVTAIIAVVGTVAVYSRRISKTVGGVLTFVCFSLALSQFFCVDGNVSGCSSSGTSSCSSGASGLINGFLASDQGGISQSGIINSVFSNLILN